VHVARPVAIAAPAAALVAAAAAVWFTLLQPAEGGATIARVGAAAPQISLPVVGGGTSNLAGERGKVVLVNFWATWCGPCEAEIPWFIEFEKKYKDQGFAVLGVSMDDDGWKSVRPYVASHKINYRIMIGSEVVSQQFGEIDSLPTSFMLDREGRIASNHIGLVDKVDYQNEIVKLLEAPRNSAVRDASAGVLAGLTGAGLRAGQRP